MSNNILKNVDDPKPHGKLGSFSKHPYRRIFIGRGNILTDEINTMFTKHVYMFVKP